MDRQKLVVRDLGSVESMESSEILDAFPAFHTAQMGQKIRNPAVADLFRGSLVLFGYINFMNADSQIPLIEYQFICASLSIRIPP